MAVPVLAGLSLLYRAAVAVRRGLYRFRIQRSRELPCKVISVGNLTLGGTGKTPMVIALAGILVRNNRRPAVVSRGYGRQNESETLVVSDGQSVLTDARTGGDEPVLIGARLTNVPVVVGANRFEAATTAIRMFHPDTIILDDGFQHFRLRRNVDIVLVDAGAPFGNGRLFPAGILREPVFALQRAHVVVITKADDPQSATNLRDRIRKCTTAPVFTSVQRPVELVDILTGDVKPLSVLRGTRVLAFSGIARPAAFFSSLEKQGAIVAEGRTYADHYAYQAGDLASVYQKAADARANLIVTTEKDAVRLRGMKPEGIWAMRIELEIIERTEWESFILGKL